MTRVLIIVAILLLIVYFLRSAFQVNAGARRRTIQRDRGQGGPVIEGETPRVRDADEARRERDRHT